MLICLDLSRLYFALRDLRVQVDYAELLNLLRQQATGDVDILGFTVADRSNERQMYFLNNLTRMGVDVKIWDAASPPSFTAEIATYAGMYVGDHILVVSGDAGLIRVFDILKEDDHRVQLSFFSEKLDPAWVPLILSGKVDFIDLSVSFSRTRTT